MQGFLYLRKFIVVCCCLLAICPSSFGGNIKGHVYGKNNSEQLIGVTIILNPSHTKTTSALDGGFALLDIKDLAAVHQRLRKTLNIPQQAEFYQP